MVSILRLIVPVLVPSWKFFSGVAPSPRLEVLLAATQADPDPQWRELCPRPATVSLATMARRMLFNRDWNETLFLVSLSERLIAEPTTHTMTEVRVRIARLVPPGRRCTQFRLTFVSRDGDQLGRDVLFLSDPVEGPV